METRRARLSARKSLLNGPFHGTAFSSRWSGGDEEVEADGDFVRDDGLKGSASLWQEGKQFSFKCLILFQSEFAVCTS